MTVAPTQEAPIAALRAALGAKKKGGKWLCPRERRGESFTVETVIDGYTIYITAWNDRYAKIFVHTAGVTIVDRMWASLKGERAAQVES